MPFSPSQHRRQDPHRSRGQRLQERRPLVSYAGIAPTTLRSGTSIRGEFANRGGNKRLKSSLYNSAFAALHHLPSRAYYDRKIAEGKRHRQAIIALGRCCLDTLYAMLRDGTLYRDPASPAASEHSLAA
nr:transposase [Nesterenkonia sp. AY15]